MEATINGVFYQDNDVEVELGETKQEAVLLDWIKIRLASRMSANITMSKDPSDGGYYALLIGLFIDGVEAQYTTSWLRNDDDQRARTYTLEIPKIPIKLMQAEKTHSVQFKIGQRRVVFGIPLPALAPRNYDLAESEVYYYKIGPKPTE